MQCSCHPDSPTMSDALSHGLDISLGYSHLARGDICHVLTCARMFMAIFTANTVKGLICSVLPGFLI